MQYYIFFIDFYFNINEKKLSKKIFIHCCVSCIEMLIKFVGWLISSRSMKLDSAVFYDNLRTNTFMQCFYYDHLPFTADFLLSFFLLPPLSPFFLFFFFFFLFRLLLCALCSISTLLINKSYPEFLLFSVSSEKLTSYLTAGTQRRRTRTSAVFHSLVFTHAEINFVHFPFPVARRRRGHRDKAALKPSACILTVLLLSLISRRLHHSAIIQRLLYAICIKRRHAKPKIKYTGHHLKLNRVI